MADPIRAFAKRLRKAEKLAERAATQPQLAYSTIEDGAVQSRAIDGSLQMIMGRQFDGTQSVAVVNGPVPPTPSAPIANAALEGVDVFWDGNFAGGEITPMNFGRVEVHASIDPDFPATAWETLIGFFNSPRGGQISRNLVPNTYTIKLVAVSQGGVRSAPSAGTVVTPIQLIDIVDNPADSAITPPDASPAIRQVQGYVSGLTVMVDPFPPSTLLDFLIDGVPVAVNQRTQIINLTTSDGTTPLVLGTDYTVTVQAHNAATDADPLTLPAASAGVVGRLDPAITAETVLPWVAAGFVLAGEIEVGNISIRPSRPAAGADPGDHGGIQIQLANGGQIWFPADGSDAIITARLFAQELEVQGNMRILGENNDLLGGLYIAATVEPPLVAPDVSTTVTDPEARTALPGVIQTGGSFAAFVKNPTLISGVWWVLHSGAADPVRSYDNDGVEISRLTPPGLPSTVVLTGITKLGTSWYALGTNDRVYVYNSTFSTLSTSFALDASIGDYWTIDNDGTNLIFGVVYVPTSGSNELRMAVVSTANVRAYWVKLDAALPLGRYPSGVYRGAADFGATRVIVTYYGSGGALTSYYAYSHTTTNGSTATRDVTKDWLKRDSGNYDGGLYWDGVRFHGAALNKIAHFGSNTAAVTRDFDYTWRKSGSGEETPAGPPRTFTAPIRSWTKVSTGTPSDPADSVRIYIDNNRQADPGVGVTSVIYDANYDLSGADSPLTNTGFEAIASPGFIRSKATDAGGALVDIEGSGAFRGGAYRSNAAGVVVGGVGETFQVACTADANTTGTGNVTIPGLSISLTSPGTGALWKVTIDADVQINAGGTINRVLLLVDGVEQTAEILTSGAAGTRAAGSKTWVVTGLSAGVHTLTARTRNSIASTDATVRVIHTLMTSTRSM